MGNIIKSNIETKILFLHKDITFKAYLALILFKFLSWSTSVSFFDWFKWKVTSAYLDTNELVDLLMQPTFTCKLQVVIRMIIIVIKSLSVLFLIPFKLEAFELLIFSLSLVEFLILPQSKTKGCDLQRLQSFFHLNELLTVVYFLSLKGLRALKVDIKVPTQYNQ